MHPLQTRFIPRIELLAARSQCVLWIMNGDYTQNMFVSSNYRTIWGRDPVELYADMSSWKAYLNDVNGNALWEECRKRIINPEHTVIYSIKLLDQSTQWVQDRSFHFNDAQGKCLMIAGVAKPISAIDMAKENQPIISDVLDSICLEYYQLLSLSSGQTIVNSESRLINKLNAKQQAIYKYLLLGLTAKEIAKKTDLSFRTIESHTDTIKKIFHVQTKSELITLAIEKNWVTIHI